MTRTQTLEILNVIKSLPAQRIDEVRDFAIFLRDRYGKVEIIDESDEWTDEDLNDLSLASFEYFEESEQKEEAST
jgi:hypothetical protein